MPKDHIHRVPLTSFQEELWLAHESLPEHHPGLSTGAVYDIEGEIDTILLRRAFSMLAHRFPLMAATLHPTDREFPEWEFHVWPDPELLFEDFQHHADPYAAAQQWRYAFQERPFQPLGGRLVSFALLTLSSTRHQLLCRVFHLAADGLALEGHVFQVQEFYETLRAGMEPELFSDMPVAPSWSQDVEQERVYLDSSKASSDSLFWEQYLTMLPNERLFSPSLRAPQGTKTEKNGPLREAVLPLSAEGAGLFFALAQHYGAGPSALLAALHVFWLARLLDKDKVLLYQPFSRASKQDRKNFRFRQGYRVATVPLCIHVDFSSPFGPLLESINTLSASMRRRLSMPVQKVARRMGLQLPPVETFANYLPLVEDCKAEGFHLLERQPTGSTHDPFILGVHALPGLHSDAAPALRLTLMFHEDYFCLDDMQKYVIRLEQALRAITADPAIALAAIPFLTAEEETALRRMEAGVTRSVPDQDIPALFDAKALAFSEHTAVHGMTGETRTYAEVRLASDALALHLSGLGIAPGQVVAVLAPRHVRLAETLLGIMKAHAVYLPMDPDYPEERLRHMLQDSGARLLISLPGQLLPLDIDAEGRVCGVALMTLPEHPLPTPKAPPARKASPKAPAYLIYTSGSTGVPKGVMLCHRSFINMTLAQIEAFSVTSSDGVLQFASPSFDASLSEIFMALLTGATLFPVTRAAMDDPQALSVYMVEHGVTVLTLPPSYLALYRGEQLRGVRLLITAGEAPVLEDVRRHAAYARYFNAYGPTEASVCATLTELFAPCAPEDCNIGRPLPNTFALVLDSHGQRLPPGLPGELCLGGEGLALGYHNRPALTAQAFIYPPCAPQQRFYRTGDRAVWTEKGDLHLLGRMDDQVKIRGHRVELGEVEAHLEAHPDVARAAALTLQGHSGLELAAAVECRPATTTDELRLWLGKRMPAALLPHRLLVLDRMPVAPSGKVDKAELTRLLTAHVLPLPDASPASQALSGMAQVRACFAEILGHDVSDTHATWHALGGDSLSAIRLVRRLSEVLGLALSARAFFADSSLAGCTRMLSSLPPTQELAPAPLSDTLPLSAGQMQMWAQHCTNPSPRYNMPFALRVCGQSKAVEAFLAALPLSVASQPLCRSVIGGEMDTPHFVPAPQKNLFVERLDLRLSPQPQEDAARLCDVRIHAVFDLGRAPGLRLCALHMDEQSWILLLVMHHGIADGESLRLVLCNALHMAQGHSLKESPADLYAALCAHHAAERACITAPSAADSNFWQQHLLPLPQALQLTPVPAKALTECITEKPAQRGAGQLLRHDFDSTLLRTVTTKEGVTLLEAFLGRLLAFLQHVSCREDVCVAVPVSTRDSTALSAVAGYFVNMLILRLRKAPAQATPALHARLAASLLREALTHSALPFASIHTVLGLSVTSLERFTTVMGTHIDLAHMADSLHKAAQGLGLDMDIADAPLRAAKFPFSFLLISEQDGRLSLGLEFDEASCSPPHAHALFQSWTAFLEHDALPAPVHIHTDALPHAPATCHVPNIQGKDIPAHAVLRQTWEDILGAAPQHTTPFFEHGGDSIKAIQMVGQLRRHGVTTLLPTDFFQTPEFSALCDLLSVREAAPPAHKDEASTDNLPVPLLPMQALYLRQYPEHWRHFHMALPLRLALHTSEAELTALKAAVHALPQRHEALRMDFSRAHEGVAILPSAEQAVSTQAASTQTVSAQAASVQAASTQTVSSQAASTQAASTQAASTQAASTQAASAQSTSVQATAAHPAFVWEELSLPEFFDEHQAFTEASQRLFTRLDGFNGPLWGAVLLRRGAKPPLLLLGLHHFICDALSLDIVRQDLAWFCRHGSWSPSGSWGMARWARHAVNEISPPSADLDADHTAATAPLAPLRAGLDTVGLRVRRETTLCHAPSPVIREHLLAALGRALHDMEQYTPLTLLLEEHGRNAPAPADLAQSVGWFTLVRPLRVCPAPLLSPHEFSAALAEAAPLSIPLSGLGRASCSLNYLGELAAFSDTSAADAANSPSKGFTLIPVPELALPGVLPLVLPEDMALQTPLEFTAWFDADKELHLMAWFSPHCLTPDWVETLLHAWTRQLHILEAERPTQDSPDLRTELANLCGCAAQNIALLRPTCPNQESMIYHALLDDDAAYPAHLQQIAFQISGDDLDPTILVRAWERLLQRHEALRSRFVRAHDGDYRCVVLHDAHIPLEVHTYSGLPHEEACKQFADLLDHDRHTRFDLARGPLLHARLADMPEPGAAMPEHSAAMPKHCAAMPKHCAAMPKHCAAMPEHSAAVAKDTPCFVMSWTFSHILMDGWCLGILLEELRAEYAALHGGAALPPASNLDAYCQWLTARSLPQETHKARVFWQELLCNAPCTPLFPVAQQSTATKPQTRELRLDTAHVAVLRRMAAHARVTLPHLLQALWALLVHGESASPKDGTPTPSTTGHDVLLGLVVAGRPAEVPYMERTVGMFARTIPLRARWTAHSTLAEAAALLRDQAIARAAHEHLPLADILHLSPAPLFDHVLVFENTPLPQGNQGLQFKLVSGYERPPFPLALSVVPEADGLLFRFLFQEAVLEQGTKLMARWQALLEFLQHKGTADIPCTLLLREAAVSRPVPMAWNNTQGPYPQEGLVCAFLHSARTRCDATACIDTDGTLWTYAQLEEKARRVATALSIAPGEAVALLLPRGAKAVAAMLGILMAGGCYVPLDHSNPPARHAHMLRTSQCRKCITNSPDDSLPEGVEHYVFAAMSHSPPCTEIVTPTPESPAYIMFTSGSTGEPKGVLVPQRAVLRLVCHSDFWHVQPGEHLSHTSSPAFDAATLEIWGALLCGGVIVCADNDTLLNPDSMGAFLRERRVEHVWLTSSLCNMLIDADPRIFAHVRHLFVGGEVLSAKHMHRLMTACPGLCVRSCYGPTENTTFTTTYVLTLHDVTQELTCKKRIPIGRPVSNTRVYILNENKQLCAVGEAGELYTAGDGLALGYVGRPDLTAAAFIYVEGLGKVGGVGERVYRTGDIALWREDGVLEFLGRRDGQVKIRGYRIELEEVEQVLCALDGVTRAGCAAPRPDTGYANAGDTRMLTAAVCLRQNTHLAPQDIVQALAARVPSWMIPERILVVDSLPMTVNGKLDRIALESLTMQAPTDTIPAGTGKSAATTQHEVFDALEQQLAALFAEVLNVRVHSPADDFLLLGGQSLKAMRLLGRINSRLMPEGARLHIRDIMTHTRVDALARRIRKVREIPLPASAKAFSTLQSDGTQQSDCGLSAGQERLWTLQQLHPHNAAYTLPFAVSLSPATNTDALNRALALLETRHEALRLRLPGREAMESSQELRQRVAESGTLRLAIHPCTQQALAEAIIREAQQPFAMGYENPLVRAALFTSTTQTVLLLNAHHAVMDGWSFEILLQELPQAYSAALHNTQADWEPCTPYTSYVHWQRALPSSPHGQACLDYWGNCLTPLPEPVQLPLDKPRPPMQSFDGDVCRISLPNTLTQKLRAEAASAGTTLFPLLLAFTSAFLYRHTGQSDLVLGVPVAGRENEHFLNSVGFFVNTLPLRQTFDPMQGLRALARHTAAQLTEALAHQALPLETILATLPVPRQAARNPLFDVLVAYEEQAWAAPDALCTSEHLPAPDVLSMKPWPLPHAHSKLDLSFYFREKAQGLDLELEYATALFDTSTMQSMTLRFVHYLEQALRQPEMPLCHISLLPPSEAALLDSFNQTRAEWNLNSTVDEQFRQQALQTPQAIALREADQTISYADLEGRAAVLAARLREAGLRTGHFVGVCCPRSMDMMTAIFAIMRAGGVYVPLVPNLPPARLTAMLDDIRHASGDATHCPLVLVSPAGAEAFAAHEVICVDPSVNSGAEDSANMSSAQQNQAQKDSAYLPSAHPLSTAYVIFTSGSTGRPKGVPIRHESVLNRLFWMQSRFPLDERDVLLQKTPISFDVSIWELLWWSWTGASLALLEAGGEMDPAAIVDAVQRHGVTVMHFVPSMLRAFVEHLELRPECLPKLRSLRYIFASGEALTPDITARCNALLHAHNGTQLHNLYGPTEATVDVTWQPCSGETGDDLSHAIPIGRPIANTRLRIVDEHNQPVPVGVSGELCLRGVQVAEGYVNRPEQTQAAFVPDPDAPHSSFSSCSPGSPDSHGSAGQRGPRMYRTGDLCRWRESGVVDYLGRKDDQVKIRGFRIELGEVESALQRCPGIRDAAVRVGRLGDMPALEAFICPANAFIPSVANIRASLATTLPDYMHPSLYFCTSALPLSPNGKTDRKALHGEPMGRVRPPQEKLRTADTADIRHTPTPHTEDAVRAQWAKVVPEAADCPADAGFFEVGGSSLLLIRLHHALDKGWPGLFSLADLFTYATISRQAERIDALSPTKPKVAANIPPSTGQAVAVIGMALRLADYEDADAFWADLTQGHDRTIPLPPAREKDVRALLTVLGYDTENTLHVRPLACLHDIAGFDCRRSGMSPADARLLNPEQRLFLETALRALEDAGYAGDALSGAQVGVFAGASPSHVYYDALIRAFPHQTEKAYVLNVPSATATRIGYLKDWSGPAEVVDTACSSALKALLDACTALQRNECSVALAGAAKLHLLPVSGANHFAIETKTGQTRTFDAAANGVGSGEGAVIFVLKPLEQALAHGDAIHAVIRGGAVTQNGRSANLAAPRPDAQASAIRAATANAGLTPHDLHFFEAHGTATVLGDPVEIAGLTLAFDTIPADKRPISSVKGNFGHLDSAAGALGIAKAILALKHGLVPRQAWYEKPNPAIDFAASPVRVAAKNEALPANSRPWRCGVSSFGISGINVHMVLEEAPATPAPSLSETVFCLPLSASDDLSLRLYAGNIANELEATSSISLCAVAATLALGREHLPARMAVLAQSPAGAAQALRAWLAAPAQAPLCATELGKHPETIPAFAHAVHFIAGERPLWPEDLPTHRVHLPTVPLNRQRCWPEWPAPLAVTLLGQGLSSPEGWSFSVPVAHPAFWPVAEHRVAGRPILVGMGSVALLGEAWAKMGQSAPLELANLVWQTPLVVESPQCAAVLHLAPVQTADTAYEASLAMRASSTQDWISCVRATVRPLSTHDSPAPLALDALRADVGPEMADALPMPADIIQVSPRWHCLRSRRRSTDGRKTLLLLELSEEYRTDLSQGWHPALLDVAASGALTAPGFVPAVCESVRLYQPLPQRVYAWCVQREGASTRSLRADCTLLDEKGTVLAALHGLTFLALSENTAPRLHELVWKERPRIAASMPQSVCLVGSGSVYDAVAQRCQQQGVSTLCFPFPQDDAARDALAHTLAARQKAEASPNALAVLCFLQDADCGWPLAACLQAVLRKGLQQALRWTVVTHNAFGLAAIAGDSLQARDSNVVHGAAFNAGLVHGASFDAPLSLGVSLCLPQEEALLRLRLVDVEPGTPADCIWEEVLLSEAFASEDCAPLRLLQNGTRLSRELSPPLAEIPEHHEPSSAPQGCVVISGGLGGMGLTLAERAVPLLGSCLALLTRPHTQNAENAEAPDWENPLSWPQLAQSAHSPTAEKAAALLRLSHKGIALRVYVCDVTQYDDLSRTLTRIRADLAPIEGIIHTAGVAGDGFLLRKSAATFKAVLAPKVEGARHLHELTRTDPLRFFVLASSRTGLTGAPGQSDYTAANAWLDALAQHRRMQGLPALSVNWNTLAKVGMAARANKDTLPTNTHAAVLPPELLMDVLVQAMHSGAVQTLVTMPGESLSAKSHEPSPEVSHAASHTPAFSPTNTVLDRDGLAALVLEIIQQELDYDDPLSEDDDYYELGGDSLTATTIVNRISASKAVTASLTDLLANSRLGDLIKVLATRLSVVPQEQRPETRPSAPTPIPVPQEEREFWPISHEQSSVLLAEMSAEAGTSFNLPNFVRLPAHLSASTVEQAVNALVQRHEILRTSFVLLDAGTPDMHMAMRLLPPLPFRLTEHRAPALDTALTTACIRPFDLFGEEPLFRAMLLHVEQETLLFFDIHHALADARTVAMLLHELYLLCHSRPLPSLGPQLKDAALRQQQYAQSAEGKAAMEHAREFWLAQYPGVLPQLHLPADQPRPRQHTRQGASHGFSLSEALTTRLRLLARKQGVPLYTVLLTLWQLLLTRYAGTSEVVMATAAETRTDGDLAHTPGMFVSLLPMRLRLLPGDTLEQLLRRNQHLHVSALEHRHYSLHQLLADLRPLAAPERTLLAEISFSYMNFGPRGEGFEPLPVPNPGCKADIAFFVSDTGQGLYVAMEYYAAIFSPERMERMGLDFLAMTEHTVRSYEDNSAQALTARHIQAVCPQPPSAQNSVHTEETPPVTAPEIQAEKNSSPHRDAWQERILHAFRQCFGPDVHPDDDFFALGGHSLLAVQLVNALSQKGALRVSTLYDHPSPAALARHMTERQEHVPPTDSRMEKPSRIAVTAKAHADSPDEQGLLPAGHAQQRLYVAHQRGGSNAYNTPFLFRLQSTPEHTPPAAEELRENLLEAMRVLCRHHQALRTAFVEHDGNILRLVCPLDDTSFADAVDKAFSLHPQHTEKEALRAAGAFMLRPFVLSAPPLFRVGLFPYEGGMLAALSMHHIIGDGWSMQILLRQWMALLDARTAPLALSSLQPLPDAFPNTVQEKDWSEECAFWRQALHNANLRLNLPCDVSPTLWTEPPHMALVAAQFSPATTDGLRRAARSRGVSLASLLLGLYGILLYRLTRQEDMVVSVGVAGRENPLQEQMVGFFINVLPIRMRIDHTTELNILLQHTHRALAEALSRQDFPYDLLVREISPSRREDMLNVAFEYQRYSDLQYTQGDSQSHATQLFDPLPEEMWMDMCGEHMAAKYDLSLFVQDIPAAAGQAEGLRLKMEYSCNMLQTETARLWLSHFMRFADMVSQGDTKE